VQIPPTTVHDGQKNCCRCFTGKFYTIRPAEATLLTVANCTANEEEEMAVREQLRIQQPDFYRDVIFKLAPNWDKCTSVLADYVENNDISVK
jgi:hypothetical protein